MKRLQPLFMALQKKHLPNEKANEIACFLGNQFTSRPARREPRETGDQAVLVTVGDTLEEQEPLKLAKALKLRKTCGLQGLILTNASDNFKA
jgi:hypothetical protein